MSRVERKIIRPLPGRTANRTQQGKAVFANIICVDTISLPAGELNKVRLFQMPAISSADKPGSTFKELMEIARRYGIDAMRADMDAQEVLVNANKFQAFENFCLKIRKNMPDSFLEFQAALQKIYGECKGGPLKIVISTEGTVVNGAKKTVKVINFLAGVRNTPIFDNFLATQVLSGERTAVEKRKKCPENFNPWKWNMIRRADDNATSLEKAKEMLAHWRTCKVCQTNEPDIETIINKKIKNAPSGKKKTGTEPPKKDLSDKTILPWRSVLVIYNLGTGKTAAALGRIDEFTLPADYENDHPGIAARFREALDFFNVHHVYASQNAGTLILSFPAILKKFTDKWLDIKAEKMVKASTIPCIEKERFDRFKAAIRDSFCGREEGWMGVLIFEPIKQDRGTGLLQAGRSMYIVAGPEGDAIFRPFLRSRPTRKEINSL